MSACQTRLLRTQLSFPHEHFRLPLLLLLSEQLWVYPKESSGATQRLQRNRIGTERCFGFLLLSVALTLFD